MMTAAINANQYSSECRYDQKEEHGFFMMHSYKLSR